jgi:hypothetical protein
MSEADELSRPTWYGFVRSFAHDIKTAVIAAVAGMAGTYAALNLF